MSNKFPKILIAPLILVALILCSVGYVKGLDYLMSQRDADKLIAFEKEQKANAEKSKIETEKKIATEGTVLNFETKKDYILAIETNFGTMDLETNVDYAPETVKNFVTLAYRGYYDNTSIHRIVESETFGVIQGGDKEKGDGTGGRSAKWTSKEVPNNVPDELWSVKPEFVKEGEIQKLANTPVFRAPQFYTKFDTNTGQVTYPKGTILMAKTQAPNSASSQFFINLVDTTLPAQYTVFGIIKDATVLDKISKEVTAVSKETNKATSDGIPDKEIKISKISIKS